MHVALTAVVMTGICLRVEASFHTYRLIQGLRLESVVYQHLSTMIYHTANDHVAQVERSFAHPYESRYAGFTVTADMWTVVHMCNFKYTDQSECSTRMHRSVKTLITLPQMSTLLSEEEATRPEEEATGPEE